LAAMRLGIFLESGSAATLRPVRRAEVVPRSRRQGAEICRIVFQCRTVRQDAKGHPVKRMVEMPMSANELVMCGRAVLTEADGCSDMTAKKKKGTTRRSSRIKMEKT
jgi:hypothetical protein